MRWDARRDLPHGDADGRYRLTALGAAAEGFRLGASSAGAATEVTFSHDPERRVAARLTWIRSRLARHDTDLARVLPYRQTTRWAYARRSPEASDLALLEAEADRCGCRLAFKTDRPGVRTAAELIGRGAARNFADREVFEEFCGMLRFDRTSPEFDRDGLTIDTLARGPLGRWALAISLRPASMRMLGRFRFHHAAAATQSALARRSPVIGVLCVDSPQPEDVFLGGRAMLRVWLAATRLGLKVHPMTAGLDHPETRRSTLEHFGMGATSTPVLCFRLGYGAAAPRSPRLPLPEIAA